MTRSWIAVALGSALLGWASEARAQRTTEQFIPVGQSPGISGVRSYTGAIVAVDAERRTVTVRSPTAPLIIKITARTRVFLDRSAQRLTNEVGSMTDLQVGRRVEIKFVDDETRDTADWIKVVVPAGG
jgi:hypothetical protein